MNGSFVIVPIVDHKLPITFIVANANRLTPK